VDRDLVVRRALDGFNGGCCGQDRVPRLLEKAAEAVPNRGVVVDQEDGPSWN